MSVTFVIGRAGSGKTLHCFNHIVDALRADPLGRPIFWLLPRQATFTAERRLTCASGLPGFCRARVVSFEQFGEEIFAECGGSAVPEVTPIGRQMIVGHLLRRLGPQLLYFTSVDRQTGLAAQLDATFDELERAGKTAADLAMLLDDLARARPTNVDGNSLRGKIHDLRLIYQAYGEFLGQDRLDPHRRLQQILSSVGSCAFIRNSTIYVDGFLDFTDHERRMLAGIARSGAHMQITMLMDPASPLLIDPSVFPRDMGLFYRTESTYRWLRLALADEGVTVEAPIRLVATKNTNEGHTHRLQVPALAYLEREMFPNSPPGIELTGPLPISSPPPRGTVGGARVTRGARKTAPPSDTGFLFAELDPPIPVGGTVAVPSSNATGGAGKDFTAPAAAPPSAEGIELLEAPDRVAEVDAVARRIRDLLQSGHRLRDIAVIARDLTAYQRHISASFEEHGIAFFLDRRRSASHHPLLQLLRGALQAAAENWSHDAVLALIKSGLAGLSLDEADDLENYVLLHRVRGIGWNSPEPWAWRRDLLRRGENAESEAAGDAARVDHLRRRVVGALSPLVRLLSAGTPIGVSEIASKIFAMFDRLGVRDTLMQWMAATAPPTAAERERPASAVAGEAPAGGAGIGLSSTSSAIDTAARIEQRDEHHQVWTKLTALFDQMVDLLGDQQVSPQDFIDIVESGLERFDLAITPPTVDQVLVGAADRTRPPPVRTVFVLGLNEGEFPARPKESSVLSDRERHELSRRKIQLDGDGTRKLLDERLLGYLIFTQPSQNLILSRSCSDEGGRPTAPSPFWRRIEDLFPLLKPTAVQREHAGVIEQIATPRQLITGVMRWIARGGADAKTGVDAVLSDKAPAPANLQPAVETANASALRQAWLALYQWLATLGRASAPVGPLLSQAWRALDYQNEARLAPAETAALFANPLAPAVAQLETYAACPFKHYVRHGLNLQPREEADVGAGDLGQVYHRLLKNLVAEVIEKNPGPEEDPLPISAGDIHAAAYRVGKSLRGELMLSTARNRYLLRRVERTLVEVIASQRELMKRNQFRPAQVGVAFGSGHFPPLRVRTPSGADAPLAGRIDRVDVKAGAGSAIVIDYRLGAVKLSLQEVFHGLSLELLADLLILQSAGEQIGGGKLTPAAAFYLQLLRGIGDVDHPDEAMDPHDERALLAVTPRGVFDFAALADLDNQMQAGRSIAYSVFVKKDGSLGNVNSTDAAHTADFLALLEYARRKLGQLAEQMAGGNIAVAPYRLARTSPCAQCEFRGLCRFETQVNKYRFLNLLKREQVLEEIRKEAADAG